MRLYNFLFATLILFVATGCVLRQIADENPIRIEGRYEFVSLDMSVFGNINTQPVQNGEASFDPVRRFRARYIDPILKKEIINLDGEFIVKGNKIELNLPEAKLNGNFRFSNRRGETRLTITWRIQGDSRLYNWILSKN
ncbi:MAG: hypothetical protein A3B86_03755 [Candidatus Yanofskybacteria bacterium RIFCSPHIGHO2_02_FULL_38_22b]|uniref:Uncharacterized protein n=1 Tax=Candidatus Yanofskybacteria bacterium RIFCSPHIGHO2_02_FULL_38_22b TaxID=1802673 RepID=A0A1F8EZB2_9BACT|nr:MAG: hypothetical protein A2816_01520 [Candidatus Yanofskybacteria bacterium RIFCSPHIGHO2_01_FULL_39_44]OGN06207.1 MAG: hypothetical protein A3B86_03755 [Candidatus Yanofskybacteria bacterium RIFCSPHIGHO2_02_FULL_38_22b]OGN19626.1 MAG: hypothetical protein A2910_03485 [Candidatus Yanofskybacteria bacterium RIFCSPLOWO2_01_FULL_39_28]